MHSTLTVERFFHDTTTGYKYSPKIYLKEPYTTEHIPNFDDDGHKHLEIKDKDPKIHEKKLSPETNIDVDILSNFQGLKVLIYIFLYLEI